MESFYFIYEQNLTTYQVDVGFYWSSMPEFNYGFYTIESAIDALQCLYPDDILVPVAQDSDFIDYVWHFPSCPWIRYKIFDFGIAYCDSPSVRKNSPWYVGAFEKEKPSKPLFGSDYHNVIFDCAESAASSGEIYFRVYCE